MYVVWFLSGGGEIGRGKLVIDCGDLKSILTALTVTKLNLKAPRLTREKREMKPSLSSYSCERKSS